MFPLIVEYFFKINKVQSRVKQSRVKFETGWTRLKPGYSMQKSAFFGKILNRDGGW